MAPFVCKAVAFGIIIHGCVIAATQPLIRVVAMNVAGDAACVSDIEFVAVAVRIAATSMTIFCPASNGNLTRTGLLKGDDTLNGLASHLIERGATKAVAVAAIAR